MLRSNVLRRLARLCVMLPLAIPLASCKTTDFSVLTTKVACGSFVPITWSKKDTPKTIEQIKEFNAVGKELCGWKR